MNFPTRLPALLGIIAAGPMRPAALVEAIREVRVGTNQPFAVNIPLYNKRSAAFLDIAEAERVPILTASQGGPKAHLPRFRAIGAKWVHVVASPQHAAKAEAGGIADTRLVGRGRLPVRQVRNAFSGAVDAAERSAMPEEERVALIASRSLKDAALDGDVAWGKVEAGETAGLIDDLPGAEEVMHRLVAEAARLRLAA